MHLDYKIQVVRQGVFAIAIAFAWFSTATVEAQNENDTLELSASRNNQEQTWLDPYAHEFLDEDGELVVSGQLIKIEGKTITVAVANGAREKFHLKLFSKAEQKWIRHRIAEMKKIKARKAEANKLVLGLASNKVPTVIETLKRMRTFGSSASHLTMQLEPLLKSKEHKIRNAAFFCYAGIAPVNFASIERLVKDLSDSNKGFREAVEHNPRHYVLSLSRYGKIGLPYLRAIAFKGRVDVQPADQADIAAEDLSVGGPQSKIRSYACQAIAETELGEEAADILTEILDTQVENSEYDAKSIGKTIESIGKLGFKSETILDLLSSQSDEQAAVVKKALDRIEKANSK